MKGIHSQTAPLLVIGAGICWGIIGLFSRQLAALGFSPLQITFGRAAVRAVSIAAKLNCFRAGQLDVFGDRLVQYCIFQYLLLYGNGMDDVVYGSYFAVHGAKYSHDFICCFI